MQVFKQSICILYIDTNYKLITKKIEILHYVKIFFYILIRISTLVTVKIKYQLHVSNINRNWFVKISVIKIFIYNT